MYYYVPVSEDKLDDIRKNGIVISEALTDDLTLKETDVPLLVVMKSAIRPDQKKLSPDLFLNLHPYFPVRQVVAGGGYVVREKADIREVLTMYRRGAWDLPKGKQDKGETNEETALREVKEEVGATDLRLICALGTTFHGYLNLFKNTFDLKTTYWYLMAAADAPLVAQAEEEIEALEWVPANELPKRLSYETLSHHAAKWIETLLYTPLTPHS
ncbi:MAG: NUDIX domain-containing protein [Rhodothermia bacterium]|mgnify:CR=1 FL=1|nr:NUDIX domain-containing protein [Rhodothermia bacterium]